MNHVGLYYGYIVKLQQMSVEDKQIKLKPMYRAKFDLTVVVHTIITLCHTVVHYDYVAFLQHYEKTFCFLSFLLPPSFWTTFALSPYFIQLLY